MRPSSEPVTRLLMGGAVFFPLLTFLFWISSPLGLLGAGYLALLLELLPVVSLAQLPMIDPDEDLPRIPVYLSSGAIVLLIGWSGMAVGEDFPGAGAMGLGPAPVVPVLFWTVGLVTALLLLLGVFYGVRRPLGFRESPVLEKLLPRSGREKGAFALLSLAAGLGEELAYRGFAVPVLGALLGSPWAGALLSSAVFGFLHAYQGSIGVLRTGLMGLILAAGFLFSGSLWPAIFAHAILDLLAGLVFGQILIEE